jgi:hypothetical protein
MTAGHDLTLARLLADDPLDGSGVIGLSQHLDAETLFGSVIATRGRMMLAHAHDNGGIGLTKSGALNRKLLAWAVEAFDWPGYEPAEVHAVNKVVDEIDYLPGWYLHEVMKRRKFMRKHKDRLLLSPAGRQALDRPGLLLWQARQATEGWASAREIFRAAVIPDDAIHELGGRYPDASIHGFHLRVLRFLTWFGVLELATPDSRRFDADGYRYRATPLFDHFVHFHLAAGGSSASH